MSLMMFLLLAFVNSKADSADLMILKANVDSYKENILEIKIFDVKHYILMGSGPVVGLPIPLQPRISTHVILPNTLDSATR